MLPPMELSFNGVATELALQAFASRSTGRQKRLEMPALGVKCHALPRLVVCPLIPIFGASKHLYERV